MERRGEESGKMIRDEEVLIKEGVRESAEKYKWEWWLY